MSRTVPWLLPRPLDGSNRPRSSRVIRQALRRNARDLAEPAAARSKRIGGQDAAKQPREFSDALVGQGKTENAEMVVRRQAPPEICDVDGEERRMVRGPEQLRDGLIENKRSR